MSLFVLLTQDKLQYHSTIHTGTRYTYIPDTHTLDIHVPDIHALNTQTLYVHEPDIAASDTKGTNKYQI